MTLTELRYIVAVARLHHFGKAARTCFVSQPTLSVAVKKLEEELNVTLFERRKADVTVTPEGERIVEVAQQMLEQAETIRQIARQEQDVLASPLRLGLIYTIGPYLTPHLLPLLQRQAPQMTLQITEDFTDNLSEALKRGELDVIVLSLPFDKPGIETEPLYDEPFMLALPAGHHLARRKQVSMEVLRDDTLLLLGAGNCFRDQVLEVCPGCAPGQASHNNMQKTLEGSSLETIRQMVATGAGVTVLPSTSTGPGTDLSGLLTFRPFQRPIPKRRVALAYRKSFPRREAVQVLHQAISNCPLESVQMLA